MRPKHLLTRLRLNEYGLATLLAWAVALTLVTWGFRIYTVSHIVDLYGLPMPKLVWMWRGLTSDSASALIWSFFSVCILRNAYLRLLAVALWCLLLTGNMANIESNGANLSVYSFAQGMQKEFFLGTVLTWAIVLPTLAGVAAFIALYIPFNNFWQRYSLRTLTEVSIAHLFILALLMVLPAPASKDWMYFNVVEDNARNVLLFRQPRLFQIGPEIFSKFIHRDLNGKKIVPDSAGTKPNVLMIVIEGLSDHMVDAGWAPNLARRRQEGIYYKNFVSPSRRTGNGMYSLFCGDYPLFLLRGQIRTFYTTSKGADVVSRHTQRHCLPRMLANMHYRTIYMQPSSLFFEGQGALNSLIGFHEQYGREAYPHNPFASNGGWGPNDPSFFSIAEDKIYRLQETGTPWFLTVLTVGTHHPYTVPDDFMPKLPAKTRTFLYMDQALDKLLTNLETNGVMKNTLIMITADESSAPTNPGLNTPNGHLPENHGFMLVYTPDKHREVMPEVFGQPDVFLSVADYLSADTSQIPYGRSLFRHYKNFRPFFMGNVFTNQLMGMLEPKKLMMCRGLALNSCRYFAMEADDLFHTRFHPVGMTKGASLFFLSLSMRIQNTLFARPWPLPKPAAP